MDQCATRFRGRVEGAKRTPITVENEDALETETQTLSTLEQQRPNWLSIWMLASFFLVALAAGAAVFVRPGHALTAFGDFLQVFLVAVAVVVFLNNAFITRGHVRGFWFLMSLGTGLWLASLLLWAYFEVLLREPLPDLAFGDALLFLKLVPIAAALALQPEVADSHQPRIFGFLDLSLLLIYWLYLYAFWVLVYNLIPGNSGIYNFHFNAIDAVGNAILLVAVGIAALRTKGAWRRLYRIYFAAAALYNLASNLSNVAIDLRKYYTGSLYDVPLIAAMAGFGCLGFAGRQLGVAQLPRLAGSAREVSMESKKAIFWTSRLAMAATLSTPAIGLWLLFAKNMPGELLRFRILATLVTMLALTALLLIKQDRLSADLLRSLEKASQTYANLTRFRDQLIQSEKLASLGQLVAGVANEIKKALTAALEYSTRLNAQSSADVKIQSMVGKIDHYARRTSVLVENMLSFAQETPLLLAPMDVKPVVERALNLSRAGKNAQIRIELAQENNVPLIAGDASQLLQVFLHVIGNAVDALTESAGGELHITIRGAHRLVEIEFADTGPGMEDAERVFEPFYTTKAVGKGTGLGLSTCYGIITRHGGQIICRNRPEGGAVFTVLLPCAEGQTVPASVMIPLAVRET
jgi:signal transduction histidine kinase